MTIYSFLLEPIEIKEFLLKNKLVLANGCWLLSNRNNNNYEYYKDIGIHRLSAWIFNNVDIDTDIVIRHSCDNPPCWNPEHLIAGTQSENLSDAVNKGHRPRIWGKNLQESLQTHCKHGHEFTVLNTYYYPKTRKRACKECMRQHDRIRRPRK